MSADEIEELMRLSSELLIPTRDFITTEICRRVAKAGKMTSTAQYQAYRAKAIGVDISAMKTKLKSMRTNVNDDIDKIFDKFCEDSYDIEKNAGLLQILKEYKKASRNSIQRTFDEMSAVAPDGRQYPIFDTFNKTMDYAFQKVFTGAQDYTSALRNATKGLVDKGIRTMPRKNERAVTIEYATRQNLLSKLGKLNIAIQKSNYELLGADGWEIDAHSACAKDHEPYQGRQYSNAIYENINNNLKRPIGTFSCKHNAFPIILGVNSPQYTLQELQQMADENKKGVVYDGRQYTLYEATQERSKMEASIRRQKYHILADTELGDASALQKHQIKLNIASAEYKRLCNAANMPTMLERVQVAGFGRSEGGKARAVNKQGLRANERDENKSEHLPVKVGTIDFNNKTQILNVLKLHQSELESLTHEEDITITTDGAIWHTVGTQRSVHPEEIENIYGISLKGSYSYHNHPAKETYYSFSAEDVDFFFSHGVQYQQASDELYEYVMERTIHTLEDGFDINQFKKILYEEAIEQNLKGNDFDIDKDGHNIAVQALSNIYGFKYTRKLKRNV